MIPLKNKLELLEKCFTIFALIVYSGGFLTLILSGGTSDGDGSALPLHYPVAQIFFLFIYFITFCLTVKKWREVVHVLLQEKCILLLLLLAFFSTLWSDAPWITFRRSIALAGTTLFGIYFADRYKPQERLQILGWTFGLIVVSSILFSLALPKYGIMGSAFHYGSWRGIYTHKNTLGATMALAISLFLLLASKESHRRHWVFVCFVLSLLLLLFSTSKSALLNTSIILFALSFYWSRKKYYRKMMVSFASMIVVGGYLLIHIFANFHAPTELAGFISDRLPVTSETQETNMVLNAPFSSRGPVTATTEDLKTLTGRAQLWLVVLDMIKERPWLGYGYGSFWLGWDSPAGYVWRVITWEAANGHNGLLDLWLEMGLPGILVFIIGFISVWRRTIPVVFENRSPSDLFPLAILINLVLMNLTESVLVAHNTIFWVLYVSTVFENNRLAASSTG